MPEVKLISPAIEMLGSPFTIRLDTEQFVGVMVNWPLTEPAPALLKVPAMSPVTDIVPPWVPSQGSFVKDMGQLQFSPVAVEVHPPVASGCRSLTRDARLRRFSFVSPLRTPFVPREFEEIAAPSDAVSACTT
jgi:hypothetical protein